MPRVQKYITRCACEAHFFWFLDRDCQSLTHVHVPELVPRTTVMRLRGVGCNASTGYAEALWGRKFVL